MDKAKHRILLTNLGYARGINGSFAHHMQLGYRHLWCPPGPQKQALADLKSLMCEHAPDLCCLLEVDTGSFNSASLNQMECLIDKEYHFSDVENKYAPTSPLRKLPFTSGKSNGFVARRNYPFQKLYFQRGTKRLIYRIELEPQLTLYFTHFSLSKKIRTLQVHELFDLADRNGGQVILMGDFNVLTGLEEILPLLAPHELTLLNDPTAYTFFFHRRQLVLDLCICSVGLAERAKLTVIPQHYSDHAALLLELN